MVVFLTSMGKRRCRHPAFPGIYHGTMESILRQTDARFRILMVCDEEDAGILRHEGVELVVTRFVDDPEFLRAMLRPEGIAGEMELRVRIDRGCRYAIGISRARDLEPDYISFFDCDDLLSRHYVHRLLERRPEPGWVVKNGYVLDCQRGRMRLITEFNRRCGTCLAFRPYLFDFPGCPADLDQEEIIDLLGGQYVTRILGSHRFSDGFFELEECLAPLVVYRVSHAASEAPPKGFGGVGVDISEELREEFRMG